VQTGLEITVCHFPPGTSKWNKIEHRLFSHITMNWRGRPLTSHEVIVQSIAAATTRTGLRVHAELDLNSYNAGVRVSGRQIAALPLHRHDWHPDWNYTLLPEPYEQVNTAPDPFDQPSPDLAWLRHPALTGLPQPEWDTLLATLLTLHEQQRETNLHQRRGHRPRLTTPGTGRRPVLTRADRLLAATPAPPCTTGWACLRWPSLPCSPSDPKPSTGSSARSASSSSRPDIPSNPARTQSPPSATSTTTRPPTASPCHRTSRPRVESLQALTVIPPGTE
jgi:hypothetical protein